MTASPALALTSLMQNKHFSLQLRCMGRKSFCIFCKPLAPQFDLLMCDKSNITISEASLLSESLWLELRYAVEQLLIPVPLPRLLLN